MKTKTLFVALALAFALQLSITAQNTDRYVRVGDTTINLKDVDLEKGMIISKIRSTIAVDNILGHNNTEIKVYSSPNYEYYAIVYDTVTFIDKNKYDYQYKTTIVYLNDNAKILFKKHFKSLQIFRLYISFNGGCVLYSLINEDLEQIRLYNKGGSLIKKYDNSYERLYIGPTHKYFFICNHNRYQGANTYDKIDEFCNIKEVAFPNGNLTGIYISPKEHFYLVDLDREHLLYDINDNLIWKIVNIKSPIYFSFDEKRYFVNNLKNRSIEVRDLLSRKLINTIDNVYYNNEKLSIYRWNIIDSSFYTIGETGSIYVYNFYNDKCALLQIKTAPIIKKVKPYEITRDGKEFNIKLKKNNKNR